MSWALAEFDAKEAGKKEGLAQGIAIGEQSGRIEAKLDTAKNLLGMGLSLAQVAHGTGLSIEEIKELQQKME